MSLIFTVKFFTSKHSRDRECKTNCTWSLALNTQIYFAKSDKVLSPKFEQDFDDELWDDESEIEMPTLETFREIQNSDPDLKVSDTSTKRFSDSLGTCVRSFSIWWTFFTFSKNWFVNVFEQNWRSRSIQELSFHQNCCTRSFGITMRSLRVGRRKQLRLFSNVFLAWSLELLPNLLLHLNLNLDVQRAQKIAQKEMGGGNVIEQRILGFVASWVVGCLELASFCFEFAWFLILGLLLKTTNEWKKNQIV